MSTNLEAERYPLELCVEEKTIQKQKVIRTTLGDLIAAVTDEVKPFVRDPSRLYMVVSYILNDVLARHRLRAADQATSH
jgi:CII-binding regulator of phage lambda lysogenization HflD